MFEKIFNRRYYKLIVRIITLLTELRNDNDCKAVLSKVVVASKMPVDNPNKFQWVFTELRQRFPLLSKTGAMIAIHLMLAYARRINLIDNKK